MKLSRRRQRTLLFATAIFVLADAATAQAAEPPLFNDAHFHLTNYVQAGNDVRQHLAHMGTKIGRSTLFGLPLQQMWDYDNTGDFAPTYYLESDAPLYYYSFTDAMIATAYASLRPEEQARLDPMITGFNPADMYAADHIRRVLMIFPGVFCGIGEFTIHKEFVSAKIAGGPPSLTGRSLDRIFELAAETGLIVLLHNDADVPFPKPEQEPFMLLQLRDLLARHPETTVIWAHVGVGRVVRPVKDHLGIIERALANPSLGNVYFDISWDQTAKYVVATPESTRRTAELINRFPDRFLFGTDVVAPTDQRPLLAVYEAYQPLWRLLERATSEKVRRGNYERLFDAARRKVRAWEKAHAATLPPPLPSERTGR